MSSITIHKVREFTGHTGAIYSLSPDLEPGRFLSCASEGIVASWDIERGEAEAVAKAPGPIFSMRLIPERNLLLLGLENGDLLFNDLKTKQTLRRVQLHKKALFDFLPLPDGKHLVASGADGALSIWDLDGRDHLHYQKVSEVSIRTLALAPDQEHLLCGSSDHLVRVFDLGLNLKTSWRAHENSVFRIAFSPDGKTLVTTGRDAHIKSWSWPDRKLIASVPAHNYAVNDLVFPDGSEVFFSGSMDKSIKLWRTYDLKLLKVCNFDKNACHWNGVNRLLWLEGNVFSCSDDRRIMQWQFDWQGGLTD